MVIKGTFLGNVPDATQAITVKESFNVIAL